MPAVLVSAGYPSTATLLEIFPSVLSFAVNVNSAYVPPSSTENEGSLTVMVGATVSSVMTTGDDAADVLTPSDAVAVKELAPSVSVTVNEKVPVTAAAVSVSPVGTPPLSSATVVPASAVPSIVNDAVLTVADVVVIAGTGGAVVTGAAASTASVAALVTILLPLIPSK